MTFIEVKNPYTGAKLAEVPFANPQTIAQALTRATAAFQHWQFSSSYERADLLTKVAADLSAKKAEFADLICSEVGKPITLAVIEVERAITVLQWAAAETQRFAGELLRLDTHKGARAGFGLSTRFPRGVVLGISPFNFPLNLLMHKVAPALACGASILVKPSPYAPLTAKKIGELFQNYHPDLVQVVISDDQATARLCAAPEIRHISFTGSAAVGWHIRQAVPTKATTLELGGNAWALVTEEIPQAEFPKIAQQIVSGAFGYAGQSCISVQNIAIAETIWTDFMRELRLATEQTRYGDPQLASVLCGPVISKAASTRLKSAMQSLAKDVEYVQAQNREGAAPRADFLIPPTLLVASRKQAQPQLVAMANEEVFGPVVIAWCCKSLAEMIQRVNAGRYGLQAGLYAKSWQSIETAYAQLNVGGLVVNDVPTTRYDHQPYGGVKDSGLGREGIRYAMEEMTEAKFLALSSIS